MKKVLQQTIDATGFEQRMWHVLDETRILLEKQVPDALEQHALRRNIKQLRAAMRLLQADGNRKLWRQQDRNLRNLARQYNRSRDTCVAKQMLDDLELRENAVDGETESRRQCFDYPRQLLEATHTDILPAHDELMVATAACLESLQVMRSLLAQPNADLLSHNLRRSWRKAHRLYCKALEREQVKSWHRCRRWVKYLHYQMSLLSSHQGKGKGLYEKLENLGNTLGSYHDLELLQAQLEKVDQAAADKDQRRQYRKLRKQLAAKSRKALARSKSLAKKCLM